MDIVVHNQLGSMRLFASSGNYKASHNPGDPSVVPLRVNIPPSPFWYQTHGGEQEEISTCTMEVKRAQGEMLDHRGLSVSPEREINWLGSGHPRSL